MSAVNGKNMHHKPLNAKNRARKAKSTDFTGFVLSEFVIPPPSPPPADIAMEISPPEDSEPLSAQLEEDYKQKLLNRSVYRRTRTTSERSSKPSAARTKLNSALSGDPRKPQPQFIPSLPPDLANVNIQNPPVASVPLNFQQNLHSPPHSSVSLPESPITGFFDPSVLSYDVNNTHPLHHDKNTYPQNIPNIPNQPFPQDAFQPSSFDTDTNTMFSAAASPHQYHHQSSPVISPPTSNDPANIPAGWTPYTQMQQQPSVPIHPSADPANPFLVANLFNPGYSEPSKKKQGPKTPKLKPTKRLSNPLLNDHSQPADTYLDSSSVNGDATGLSEPYQQEPVENPPRQTTPLRSEPESQDFSHIAVDKQETSSHPVPEYREEYTAEPASSYILPEMLYSQTPVNSPPLSSRKQKSKKSKARDKKKEQNWGPDELAKLLSGINFSSSQTMSASTFVRTASGETEKEEKSFREDAQQDEEGTFEISNSDSLDNRVASDASYRKIRSATKRRSLGNLQSNANQNSRVDRNGETQPTTFEKHVMQIADNLKSTANSYYHSDKAQWAIRFYNRAIALCPQEYVYRLNRVAALIKLRSFSGYRIALSDCEYILGIAPNNKAVCRMILCDIALGNCRKARIGLVRAANLRPWFWMETIADSMRGNLTPMAVEEDILKEARMEGPIYANDLISERFELLRMIEENISEAHKFLHKAVQAARSNTSKNTALEEAVGAGLSRMDQVLELALASKHEELNIGIYSLEWTYIRCKLRYLAKDYNKVIEEVRQMVKWMHHESVWPDEEDTSSLSADDRVKQLLDQRERQLYPSFSEAEVDKLMEIRKMQVHSQYLLADFEGMLGSWIPKEIVDPIAAERYVRESAIRLLSSFFGSLPLPHNVVSALTEHEISKDTLELVALSTKLHYTKALANEQYRLQKNKEAEAVYTEALQLDPKHTQYNSIIYCNRATSRRRLGKYKEAIDDCTESLRLVPSYSKALLRRAECYIKIEHWNLAIADCKNFLNSVDSFGNSAQARRLLQEAEASLSAQLEEDRKEYKRKSHYEHLEVPVDATTAEIKKAYRKLALKYHPDKASEDSTIVHERFNFLKESYEVLVDEAKRKEYDRSMRIRSTTTPPSTFSPRSSYRETPTTSPNNSFKNPSRYGRRESEPMFRPASASTSSPRHNSKQSTPSTRPPSGNWYYRDASVEDDTDEDIPWMKHRRGSRTNGNHEREGNRWNPSSSRAV